ncbi:H/ACA snoRNP pseudouridylase subunit [Coccidioides posadasii str. Silveira]|uniref:D-xylose reductase [NAD(P)H] n=3 Tax=Coccidioides posadasii TaxID=199306 RepID=E9D8P8_COCPS|nr:oxidoreductase, aldo/keto reductase family protein [Coccidioides posadasii C735 delta SOWgp]EER29679.1 oxidoreductase, aldo/keto reductase family protein [Coccidioides posadasii C735 delta SOWgp]EFW16932.1 glycerol dehydrogenase [Coccidioides posadasii str. Silveira]KMM69853.1 D-arabinose dehydrogenase heavy chain [Coccidioides posadasii RMSCC 3488]QVM09077.1 H/ACA snoRNP pseudouridylase subunit [Coccidioides posadasii str. Silveira]|eukprot:XP_003071824.1 oxidoreductase, aldo/keto reductase family protein [Coccidioides posadasii C735 delta SOWgp]
MATEVTGTRFTLNTGVEIPALGLGTWQSAPGQVQAAVYHALKVGYRHVDAALCYQNEKEVGRGIAQAVREGIVRREDIFVTTKLWNTYHRRVDEGLEISLKDLGLEYVDLYLMHWPAPMNPNGNHPLFPKLPDGSRDIDWSRSHIDSYKDMEKLLASGKVKAIGVSNYSLKYLQQLLEHVSVVPAVNQIENHPLLPQQEIVDFCREKGIMVTAYSPLGSTGGPLMTSDAVVEVARRKGVSPSTILLSWHVARGSCVLSKSVTPSRIEANLHLVKLDEDDMKIIAKFTAESVSRDGFTRFVYPPFGIDFGFPDKTLKD